VTWDNLVKNNEDAAIVLSQVSIPLFGVPDKEPRHGEHEEFILPLWHPAFRKGAL
jgi:hypothetical protein